MLSESESSRLDEVRCFLYVLAAAQTVSSSALPPAAVSGIGKRCGLGCVDTVRKAGHDSGEKSTKVVNNVQQTRDTTIEGHLLKKDAPSGIYALQAHSKW